MEIREMTGDDLEQMMKEHRALNPEREIKDLTKQSLDLYADRGILPGDFLYSVLTNDLFGALGRADSYNRATIFQITQYIYNNLPSNSWGSPEKVEGYIREIRKQDAEEIK